jgi:hypothetical protein
VHWGGRRGCDGIGEERTPEGVWEGRLNWGRAQQHRVRLGWAAVEGVVDAAVTPMQKQHSGTASGYMGHACMGE